MKGHWIAYSADELAWLEANCTLLTKAYHEQFCSRFGREVSAANLRALRKRKGWKTGRTQFCKGVEPHNKGATCAPGTGGRHPNARKTQFRPGNRSGTAARNYKPIGSERLNDDGYRERKVHDGLPTTSRWQLVHRMEWEAVHGLVPAGMALKCRGNRLVTDPNNWELVSRALLPRLIGGRRKQYVAYDSAPDVLKPAIMAVARLEHAVSSLKIDAPTPSPELERVKEGV